MAKSVIDYPPVSATPVKSFFVSMLTRDISLSDAILDLLDNCVDGILRKKKRVQGSRPYEGFFAEITFDHDTFTIHDNCGGIPWNLHEYAFRMGRSQGRKNDAAGTVGTYGIGMKRAIFKLGEQCIITTKNGKDHYEIEIQPSWIRDEDDWQIPVRQASSTAEPDGTTIVVGDLHPGIRTQLGDHKATFNNELIRKIESHYAFIIGKGFAVRVNGTEVKPKVTKLIFTEGGSNPIQPFIYNAEVDGVKVFLAVGFTQPIPDPTEVLDEQEERKYSSQDAGWTILCNDRAVLYCDKTEMTGWGEAGLPRFHTQFIAISGVVEFQCDDATKLPTTTTKRGIEASSILYLQVKNKMREGMKLFVDYTNKWKSDVRLSKEHIKSGSMLSLEEIKEKTSTLTFSTVLKGAGGRQYKPRLPSPKKLESLSKRITFTRSKEEIRVVAEHLFGNDEASPSSVGERCFDEILRKARR